MPLTQPRFFKALRRVAGLLAFFAVGLYLALGVTLYVVQRDLFYRAAWRLPTCSPRPLQLLPPRSWSTSMATARSRSGSGRA